MLRICVHTTWMPPPPPHPLTMKNNVENKRKICIFLKIDQETSGKESDLPISSMESTSSMMKVFTDE